MKNKIIIISIIIVVILLIVYLIYMLLNRKPTKLNISRLEFRYNTGNAMGANVHYKIECKDKCTAIVKLDMQEEREFDVDECYLSKVEEIVNKYNLSRWDNFKKSNKHVLDGKDFDLYITTKEGKHIEASGYEMWPRNYKEVKAELDNIFNQMNYNPTNSNTEDIDLKPIIYLYPEKEINISVKLGYKEKLTISYPIYNDGWEVIATPSGKLTTKDGKEYYSLFWEGINTISSGIKDEGFMVKGEDAKEFLEEKLAILGLNYKEMQEFIIYWLPKLQNNKYNYIRFETIEEQNTNMPLLINPKPDILIRINMEYKPLDKEISVIEQQLTKVERKGYTVVEWGGTILH